MLGSKNINRKKSTDCQEESYCYVSRHICTSRKYWNQRHQIIHKNKKECCKKIWRIFLVIGSYTRLYYTILYCHHKHFHKACKLSRHTVTVLMLPIKFCGTQNE